MCIRDRGSKAAFLVFGVQLAEALKVAEKIDATVVDMRFVKPLDEAGIEASVRERLALLAL